MFLYFIRLLITCYYCTYYFKRDDNGSTIAIQRALGFVRSKIARKKFKYLIIYDLFIFSLGFTDV